MTDKIIIYTISYGRALVLLWGMPIIFLTFGLFNKGFDIFDINRWGATRLFGNNKIIPLIFCVLFVTFVIRETFIVIKSNNMYIYVINNSLYCKNKFVTLLSDIDIERSQITNKYFSKFLHLRFKNGKFKNISLAYAILLNENYISKITKTELPELR